jgi:TonB family protein
MQGSAASQQDTTVYINVDVYPSLVTSDGNYEIKMLNKFIGKHLMWPDPQMDCFGTVIISFVVEVDGSVSDRKYLKRLCPKFDEEAMRVASLMNKWEPGTLNRGKVRTKISIPVTFKIN